MEVLIAACLLAWAAGAQSEQARLGISPAQRALMREQVRHEKAIRKIADKHGATPAPADASPEKGAATTAVPVTVPEAFRSGYRGHTAVARVATPLGRHAGNLTARGVHWAKDTGRSAVREYRKRRKAAGQPDPAPVHVPVPPMPAHPPMPTSPPTAGSAKPSGVTLAKPEAAPTPDPGQTPPEAAQPAPDPAGTTGAPTAPEAEADPAAVPAPRAPESAPDPVGPEAPNPAEREGVGRMAAEVSYDSVMDESDELSLMCDDDVTVYRRIRERCEREIGRADTLIAQVESPGIKAWVGRCAEQYQVILTQLDELEANTVAQGEGVVKAKALLLAGQGLYAGIAADMDTVEEREFYVSDAVDGEDANAAAETYETQGVPA